jgi:hypothetical protein
MTVPQYQFSLRDIVNSIVDEYARKHKPGAGQLGLFEKPSEKQKPLFSKKVDDEAGRWVTMRGARVFISGDDGRVLKGPKRLMGKTGAQIERESAGSGEAPKPKGLAEMGRIKGGRADNRQKKLFEELNPGFKFEDDEDEDFKTVEPVVAEAPSSPADEEFEPEFILDPSPSPLPAKPSTQFDNPDPSTKQGALFDTGKKGELKGQELLFNSDAGDLNNPKTMENRAKANPDDVPTLTDDERSRLPEHLKNVTPLFASEANRLKEMANKTKASPSPAETKSPADSIQSHLDNDDHQSAFEAFSKLKKDEVDKVARQVLGMGFYNKSKAQMLEALKRTLPLATKTASEAAKKQEEIDYAEMKLRKAKENQKLQSEGLMGAPIRSGVPEIAYTDPHGEGRAEVAKAWQAEVDDAQRELDRVSGKQAAEEEDGPQDGDKDETGLVFRNGRWHRDGQEINPSDIVNSARDRNENIWTAAKREIGVKSIKEIPPELMKDIASALQEELGKPDAPKKAESDAPSLGRQKAMDRQKEKQKQDESSVPAPVTESEESGDTPREQAGHYYDTQKHNEYAWARESEVGNAGKDLIGSARHKRNEWRSLEELEERGSSIAEELITRSNLMKNNPPNLAVAAERNPVTALAMHMALNSIPARPYGVKSDEVHVDTEKKKLARKLYVEAFDSLRAKAEELAMREDDPMKALSEFANHADQIRNSYKAQSGTYIREQFNHMITIHNRTQTSLRSGGYLDLNRPVGRSDKAINVSTNIRKFAALARENYGEDWMEHDDVQEKAIDVISGSSIDKVFDISREKTGTGKYKFNPSEAYVTGKTERKGGPSVDTSTVKKSQNVLLDSLAVSGLQYGNSMTDDERKHHTAKTAEAMVDLADALGLPDKAVGMNGKLGIAFGARGRAGAKAHYEPNLNVINLTRKTGAGSLAHEWAHFVDYNTGENGSKQATRSMDGDQRKLKQSWELARSRISDAVSKAYSLLSPESRWAQVKYWTSDEEMFARFSERMVQKKLHDQGRENSYLVGLQKNSHPFWPTDSELEKSMPHLEAIYKAFGDAFEKEHGKEPKKDRYGRIQAISQEMNQIIDRYIRPENDVIQIDQYAHPLVHAAVGAGAMALANKAFKSGPMRSVAHAAIAAAMAAWMQSAMAANGIPPAQGPSSPAVSAPATPGQIQKAGNNAVNQIVNNAINQHAANSQAAATAPPSPAQTAAHSVSKSAAGKAGVPGTAGARPLSGTNAGGVPGAQPAAQSQSAGKGGPRPLRDPGDSGGSGASFSNSDHPRHPAGASEGKGGEFAPKGGVESGSSSGEPASEAPSSPAVKSYNDFNEMPSVPDGHVRVVHHGNVDDSSLSGGFKYDGDIQTNTVAYSSNDQIKWPTDNRFSGSPAIVMDVPHDVHREHSRIQTASGSLDSKYIVGRVNVPGSQSSPRNYPDNLNKPAGEQTDYSPPERSIAPTSEQSGQTEQPEQPKSQEELYRDHLSKIAATKSLPSEERQSRKEAWVKTQQGAAQQITEKKESAKAEKQQVKQMAKAVSFNPAELETPMADDIEPAGEAPKEDDFASQKEYEKALEKHNRSAGAKQGGIKRRVNANLIPEIAGEHDLNHDDLRAAVDDEIAMSLPYHKRKEEARQYISKMGWNSRRIDQAEDRGVDSSSTQFDDVASEWAGLFPEIAGSDESEWVAKMWELSKEGAQPAPSAGDEDLVRRVAQRLADSQGQSGGFSSPADEGDEEGFIESNYNPDDPDATPFSRSAVIGLIVDKYMRQFGLC